MTELKELTKEDPNIQNDISQTIDKYNRESFSTRTQLSQNAFIQSKVLNKQKLLWTKQYLIWI